ncbi:MAG: alpha-galactosidase [Oscillospiraceae bacterium]|nr:alpha-galactosidase [Oscillospiraceae bacterium]
MIRICGKIFALQTARSSYVFRVTDTLRPEKLHYGASLGWDESTPDELIAADCAAMTEKREFEPGNVIAEDALHKPFTLEDMCLELSSYGKGDIRDPFITVRNSDGSFSSDFLFEKAEKRRPEPPMGMPGAYSDGDDAERLAVTLKDRASGLTLELYYDVYADCDVICRSCRVINGGDRPVTVLRLMSTQLDFSKDEWAMTVFHGAWAREMERETLPVGHAKLVNSSFTGTSSSRSNPFVMLHRPDATETAGDCCGINLIYSGNHYSSAQLNSFGKLRFVSGINPEQFAWTLQPGEALDSPQAVMAFSGEGFGGMSRSMHRFVRKHIVRGPWRDKERPILLNSWEACYFDVNESKLLRLAEAGKKVGAELFVLDDGWFGERGDDTSSLGDWYVNTKKFPNGLSGLSRKLKELGLDFGIWIEPEMVNTDSRLYREHPEWTMDIPGRDHAEGRNQRILDLADEKVTDYLAGTISAVLREAEVSYVKWDMNRIFSDVFSRSLPAERQGETAHRYVLGLYRLMDTLTRSFPDVLFEGCSSGGNRFDLGILCYCPQIWASDNTDAVCRAGIQEGYSYAYPMSAVGAHVSASPNHQTMRITSAETRFDVAAFGVLGLEYDLSNLPPDAINELTEQLRLYRRWRGVLQFGDFYRLQSGNVHKWICVSPDRRRAVGLVLRKLAEPNSQYEDLRGAGLEPGLIYRFCSLPRKIELMRAGDIGQEPRQLVSRPVGQTEELRVSGAVLMNAGIRLSPFYGESMRSFPDFSARLFFMEAEG